MSKRMVYVWFASCQDEHIAAEEAFYDYNWALDNLRKTMGTAKLNIWDATDGLRGDVYIMIRGHAKVLYQWTIVAYEV